MSTGKHYSNYYTTLALIIIFLESQNNKLEKTTIKAQRTLIITDNIKFLRQIIDNSCSLIAILYCILNTIAANSISKLKICNSFKETNELVLGHNFILYYAIRLDKGIITFFKESKELEIEYQLVVKLGKIEILDNIKYYYMALIKC